MYDKPTRPPGSTRRIRPHWQRLHLIVCVFISPAVDPVLTPGYTDLQVTTWTEAGLKSAHNDPRASLGDLFKNALSG